MPDGKSQSGAEGAGAGQEGQPNNDGGEPKQSTEGMSNHDAKELPWVKDLMGKASRLDKLENEIADRKVADEKAKRDAEIKKAEEEKDYAEAQRLKDEEHKREIDELKSKALNSKLRAELSIAGYAKRGVDLLAKEYDPEKFENIESYIEAVSKDEANKIFLADSGTVSSKPKGPGKPTITDNKINWDEVKTLEHSENRKDRIKARALLRQYHKEHGAYPY